MLGTQSTAGNRFKLQVEYKSKAFVLMYWRHNHLLTCKSQFITLLDCAIPMTFVKKLLKKYFKNNILFKWATPASFSFIFDLFKQTTQCEKMSIQYMALGFEPTTSSPIITRPVPPPQNDILHNLTQSGNLFDQHLYPQQDKNYLFKTAFVPKGQV